MTVSVETYREAMQYKLGELLFILHGQYTDGKLGHCMRFTDKELGFTKNPENFSDPVQQTLSNYCPINTIGDMTLVVFVNKEQASFALLDETFQTCYPLDTRVVVDTWKDESVRAQHTILENLYSQLEFNMAPFPMSSSKLALRKH